MKRKSNFQDIHRHIMIVLDHPGSELNNHIFRVIRCFKILFKLWIPELLFRLQVILNPGLAQNRNIGIGIASAGPE